ncbi:hypothetical protein [Planococcus halotolerans]|uniref:Uncharacterized protein n=1 Tax=Planococcus halotolerans TaxID=2233542 RepID=A0A365KWV4_9BACL|nr:hypothetical protein [Planococcus halotolerans]QHJ69138.1 hypothetical protein DNR44_000105 [Planococcus halotolerans]RAZ77661.1 hypothetical protein DP120_09260 [Planococcus halotolerans]
MLKKLVSSYCLFLSLSAFLLGSYMFLGKGAFADFPPEWIGIMPFSSWNSLALFGMIVFGISNAVAGIYGFNKKNSKVFVLAIFLGALCFLCAALPIILLDEWYLPLVFLFLASTVQILLGFIGLITSKEEKRCGENLSY